MKGIYTSRESKDTARAVLKKVCSFYGLDMTTVLNPTRKREIVLARQVAMHSLWRNTKMSLGQIGMCIGDKDHATVLHAKNTVNNLYETDRRFKGEYNHLSTILQEVYGKRKITEDRFIKIKKSMIKSDIHTKINANYHLWKIKNAA